MIDKLVNSQTLALLHKGLDVASMRQRVASNNLANISTPEYKKTVVSFEEELQLALQGTGSIKGKTTNEKHIPIGLRSVSEVTPKSHVQNDTSIRNDGNNVDIDTEMALLAKNNIMYNALVQLVNNDFSKLKMVIKGQ